MTTLQATSHGNAQAATGTALTLLMGTLVFALTARASGPTRTDR